MFVSFRMLISKNSEPTIWFLEFGSVFWTIFTSGLNTDNTYKTASCVLKNMRSKSKLVSSEFFLNAFITASIYKKNIIN